MKNEIPSKIISILSRTLPTHYTAAEIDALFLYAEAPDYPLDETKQKKVLGWLRATNKKSSDPIKTLNTILEDFLAMEPSAYWDTDSGAYQKQTQVIEQDKKIVEDLINEFGLNSSRPEQSNVTKSLKEEIREQGHSAIEIEIDRIEVKTDPKAAILFAVKALEATNQLYLEAFNEPASERDTLQILWKKAAAVIKLHPKDYDDENLRQLASSLFGIVNSLGQIRNKARAVHGRTNANLKTYKIMPRHASLCVNASHTICTYLLDSLNTTTG